MAAIELIDVSKKYRKHTERSIETTLKSYFLKDLWRFPTREKKYKWALRNINLEIGKGQTIGIIGRNGSGKSTFLKLINRILKPDEGKISVHGSLAAIIELGAGFHPELTGRENVIINGVILGLSKREITGKINEIVDFAELNEVIDDPVRTYSSGMTMRLGFSVAIHTDPDILMVDEVLSVGDLSFTQKCMDRMNFFKRVGKTIVLVSHDMEIVKNWCDEAVWLDGGQLKMKGNPMEVVDSYVKEVG